MQAERVHDIAAHTIVLEKQWQAHPQPNSNAHLVITE
jgi:hypothetical protein